MRIDSPMPAPMLRTKPCRSLGAASDGGIRGLARRLLPEHAEQLVFAPLATEDGRDAFELAYDGHHVVVRGSSPVAQAAGLHEYLRQECGAHISACGDQLSLPERLPPAATARRRASPYLHRYYFNYCTFSYSMAWWTWPRWEREIDWMALNGINLPLAITGQEKVWQSVYRLLGLCDDEILDFIAGPAYLAWGWMGNLDGWGGPSPQSWIDGQSELQQRIVARERELGIRPVLPAFTGHVPGALARLYPGARMRQLAKWAGNFPGTWMLEPEDPLFLRIGTLFMEEQTRLYGTDHVYSCDSFNENSPPSNDPAYLDRMGKSLYGAMAATDPQAVWVMQAWMFFFNPENPTYWQEPQIKALLGSVPRDRMLVLDLHSELKPLWQQTRAYHGKPWIWNVLHNFGGKSPLHGNLPLIASDPPRLLRDPGRGNIAGMGLTPEGIGQNPIVYALVADMFWRHDAPDLDRWVQDYARQRYGALPDAATEAWRILLRTVYSRSRPAPRSTVCRPPTLVALGPEYDAPAAIAHAWQLLAACADELAHADPYGYDLVDLTRQVLSNHADALHAEAVVAFRAGDENALASVEARFVQVLLDLDAVLGTRREFLLGRWIADARAWGRTEAERDLLEWNARNQVTLWGNRESMLRDYARKEWSGLMRAHYLPRWQAFFAELRACLAEGRPFDEPAFHSAQRTREEAWSRGHDAYPHEPSGDSLSVVRRLVVAYRFLADETQVPISANLPTSVSALHSEADGLWSVQGAVIVPGAGSGLVAPAAQRSKALAAEERQDWNEALSCWERIIDRSVTTRAQRLEAFAHIARFRGRVAPLNTDPARARPWPTLVVVFRTVDFAWHAQDVRGTRHFMSSFSEADLRDVRRRVAAFADYVFTFTDGLLAIAPDYLVIEEPLTRLAGTGPFCVPPSIALPMIEKHLADKSKRYEHTLVYTKFLSNDGTTTLSAPYAADTGGGGPGGASYMDYPFFPGRYNGQPGEIELHEFLHPVDMIFNDVLGYPDDVPRNPDAGSGDAVYRRPEGEVGIVSLYEYLFRVRTTRLMWSELTQQEPDTFFWGGPNLSDWLLLGPFHAPGKDALAYAFIAEEGVRPIEGATLAGQTWTHVRSRCGVLDLAAALGAQPVGTVAYLATNQRICGAYTLHLGSNGGVRVWLNDHLVADTRHDRDFAFNLDAAAVAFRPGYVENTYLFKLQSTARGWKFQARVAGPALAMPWGSTHVLPGAE